MTPPVDALRRRLLQTGLAGAAALPLLPAAAASGRGGPYGNEAVLDLVVIGSGLAGLAAAAGALESGCRRVLVLEKGPLAGGHSLYSSGTVSAVDPERGRAGPDGWRDSVEQYVTDALAVGGGRGDPAVLTRIARGSGEALRWLETLGVRFGAPFEARSGLRRRSWAMPGNGAGRSYVIALMAHVRRLGGIVRFRAGVTALERTVLPGGDAPGWRVAAADERLLARAVVIATGGFTADVARRSRIDERLGPGVRTSANPEGSAWDGADGDGLDLAVSAGGTLTEGFGLQLLPFWGGRLLDYAGGDVYLNVQGERFIDENLPWNLVSDGILRQEGRFCWVVTDDRSIKGATLGLKLINGTVRKAAGLPELAAATGMPPATLEATMRRYNAAADAGFDEQTGKRIFRGRIERPPFYFGRERIYVHTTLDGVRTDDYARVLDGGGRPLPGLFAAGEVAGGIFGTDRLGGAGIANCLVMGRLAGRTAAGMRQRRQDA